MARAIGTGSGSSPCKVPPPPRFHEGCSRNVRTELYECHLCMTQSPNVTCCERQANADTIH
jgi:hypothetical protein